MRFSEMNLFGVYVAPIAVTMFGAWIVMLALRQIASHAGLLRYVWHPALFVFSIYVIVLSCWILIAASLS